MSASKSSQVLATSGSLSVAGEKLDSADDQLIFSAYLAPPTATGPVANLLHQSAIQSAGIGGVRLASSFLRLR